MDNISNKISAITTVLNGVCINDPFINLANNLAASMGRTVDYFSFDKLPNYPEVKDLCDKDTLDRLIKNINGYEFLLVDDRLDVPTLNVIIGFILSEGNQIGSFYINNPDLQAFVEDKILFKRDAEPEDKEVLVVSPDGSGEGDPVNIEEALRCLLLDNYKYIKFLDGIYELAPLYRVLSYCYGTGVIITEESKLPDGIYIKIIKSKC